MRVLDIKSLYFYVQSESPSESELNALGIYLLVCLAFVVCALAEFAMVIIFHQRSNLKAAGTITTEEKKNRIKDNRSEVPLKNKLKQATTAWEIDTSIMKPCPEEDYHVSKWITKIRREISIIPLNGVIDFIAIWIHFFLFVLFNCAYWITYWNN